MAISGKKRMDGMAKYLIQVTIAKAALGPRKCQKLLSRQYLRNARIFFTSSMQRLKDCDEH